MPRPRKPEGERREVISIRLPGHLIDKLKKVGKPSETIEKALNEYFKRQN